jgi:hypothetical protein
MSLQAASLGRFWLGPQSAKGTVSTTFNGFKANLVDVAPQQMVRNIGQLVGSNLLPGGSIKTAAWVSGAVVMPPSLDGQLGWLLHAFAGSVNSAVNADTTTTHTFPQGADDTAPAKYLTARRKVPGSTVLYEEMLDMVVYRLLFGFTPGEYANLRAEFVGREPSNPDGSAWVFTDAKDETSVPITCKGSFELPTGTPVTTSTGISLDLNNVVPDLRRVLVAGSYYPVDFPVLGRQIVVQFAHLWENADLYKSLFYSAGAWSPVIYNSGFTMTVESPADAVAGTPFSLTFTAASVDWSCQPVRLAGGDLVEMAMTGTVAASGGASDWSLALTNNDANYTWPVA